MRRAPARLPVFLLLALPLCFIPFGTAKSEPEKNATNLAKQDDFADYDLQGPAAPPKYPGNVRWPSRGGASPDLSALAGIPGFPDYSGTEYLPETAPAPPPRAANALPLRRFVETDYDLELPIGYGIQDKRRGGVGVGGARRQDLWRPQGMGNGLPSMPGLGNQGFGGNFGSSSSNAFGYGFNSGMSQGGYGSSAQTYNGFNSNFNPRGLTPYQRQQLFGANGQQNYGYGYSYAGYIERQANMYPIMMYTLVQCVPCQRAKHVLAVSYSDVASHFLELAGDEEWQRQLQVDLQAMTGALTFPYIFICGNYIGGASDLLELHRNGQLRTMVNACSRRPARVTQKSPSRLRKP